jgi:GTPase SAR1 family protein
VIGDASTDKTAVLAAYISNKVRRKYIPTAFDNYPVNLRYGYHLWTPEECVPRYVLCSHPKASATIGICSGSLTRPGGGVLATTTLRLPPN